MVLSEVFYVGLYTSLIGFTLAFTKMIYKSKCSSVDICCIKITRDTTGELKEDELELELKQKDQKSDEIKV